LFPAVPPQTPAKFVAAAPANPEQALRAEPLPLLLAAGRFKRKKTKNRVALYRCNPWEIGNQPAVGRGARKSPAPPTTGKPRKNPA
jgi:hypothetical protein